MNDEQRLSEDELAAIEERVEHAQDHVQMIVLGNKPFRVRIPAHEDDSDVILIRALDGLSALLQHIRALENELHIKRAQAARGDWLGD